MSKEKSGGLDELPAAGREKRPATPVLATSVLANSVLANHSPGAGRLPVAAESLSGDQQTALELLVMGKSIAETARSAGVSRTTIYQWMRKDPDFQAAYNQWRDQVCESGRSRLLSLTDLAAETVQKALQAGDAKTAMQLLKGMGFLKEQTPGPTDVDEVKRRQELEWKRLKSLAVRQEAQAREDEEMSLRGF